MDDGGGPQAITKTTMGLTLGKKCDSVLFKEWRAIGQQPWCVPNFVVMHRLKDGRMPSKIGKTSGVIPRLQEGRMPSNIEKSGVLPRLQEGRMPSNIGKSGVLSIDCMMV